MSTTRESFFLAVIYGVGKERLHKSMPSQTYDVVETHKYESSVKEILSWVAGICHVELG